MSVYILKEGKKGKDALEFLKAMKERQKKELSDLEEKNLIEKTPVAKFIQLKKELIELEKTDRDSFIKFRSETQINDHITKLSKVNKLKSEQASERVKLRKKQEAKRLEEEKNAAKQAKIEKMRKQKESHDKVTTRIKILEAKTTKPVEKPQSALTEFFMKLDENQEKNAAITPSDAWKMAPSDVREILNANYKESKEIQEKIAQMKEILNKGPEEDQELMQSLNEQMNKEKEIVNSRNQKKLQKKLQIIEKSYEQQINQLTDEIFNLQHAVSVSFLKSKQ